MFENMFRIIYNQRFPSHFIQTFGTSYARLKDAFLWKKSCFHGSKLLGATSDCMWSVYRPVARIKASYALLYGDKTLKEIVGEN